MIKVAVLDDYQHVALRMADWSALTGRAEGDGIRPQPRRPRRGRGGARRVRGDLPDARAHGVPAGAVRAPARAAPDRPHRHAQPQPRPRRRGGPGRAGLSHARRRHGIRHDRARLGPHPRLRPPHRPGGPGDARGRLADHGRHDAARQDARPARPRPARGPHGRARPGVRHGGDRLEPEPDRGAGCRAGAERVERASCSAAATWSASISSSASERAAWSARARSG